MDHLMTVSKLNPNLEVGVGWGEITVNIPLVTQTR